MRKNINKIIYLFKVAYLILKFIDFIKLSKTYYHKLNNDKEFQESAHNYNYLVSNKKIINDIYKFIKKHKTIESKYNGNLDKIISIIVFFIFILNKKKVIFYKK